MSRAEILTLVGIVFAVATGFGIYKLTKSDTQEVVRNQVAIRKTVNTLANEKVLRAGELIRLDGGVRVYHVVSADDELAAIRHIPRWKDVEDADCTEEDISEIQSRRVQRIDKGIPYARGEFQKEYRC